MTHTNTTPSGLKYTLTHEGQGAAPAPGDRVTVHYTGKLTDGSKFDSSFDRNKPFSFQIGARQVIPGWDEGIALLKAGSKAILEIPPHLGYGAKGIGPIPPNATLIFEVELLDVQPQVTPKPFNTLNKETLGTQSGLKYIVVEKGNGPQAQAGHTVEVHYTGYLSDGSIFDSSVARSEPIRFELGSGRVIPGWEEGIALMQTGDKLRLVIPPHLAYGEQGAGGVIPGNATIIFDVELVSVS